MATRGSRCAGLLCLWVGLLAGLAPARGLADDLFIAGTVGEVYKGNSQTGDFQPFAGICLGPIQALALDPANIYAGDMVGGVVRFDLLTGDFEGAFFVPDTVTAMVMHGADLLVSDTAGNIRRVDPASGQILDTLATGLAIEAMLMLGEDLFVAGTVGEVYRVDPVSGAVELFGGICLAPIRALGNDDQTMYAGDEAGGVARFDLQTGDFLGAYFLPVSVTAMVRDGQDLLVSGTDHTIVRVDAASGGVLDTLSSPIDVEAMYLQNAVTCAASADCADADDNGIRDDNCVWWSCDNGVCAGTPIEFADLGGEFGLCPPDGSADAHDKYHALNCFSNTDTAGVSSYPCESNPPQAFNLDAGGVFGDCNPDGVCDGHDAFHALSAFDGTTLCTCPGGGPAPAVEPVTIGRARIVLVPSRTAVFPGQLVEVDAFLEHAVEDLRGYQLHVGVSGGKHGTLELVDVFVGKPSVFSTLSSWSAFNVRTAQMVAGLDGPGVETAAHAYLATFTWQAGRSAAGAFSIELLADPQDSRQRTFLFPSEPGQRYLVSTQPAVVEVRQPAGSAARGRQR